MEGFITFVLVFVCVIWVLGKIFPRLLVWYLQRKVNKGGWGNFGRGFNGGFDAQQSGQERQKEGDVTISSTVEPQKKVFDKNDGEYIDFEE
ncbi:MAG: DUF4834 family protein [Bacteroidia bacterium]|nr:DUF4834 family protein [Bacteroidia bacterium]